MEMLSQLGVNKTYFVQLAIFLFLLFILTQHVFKDFMELLDKREKQTKGSENLAAEEQRRATEFQQKYEEKARTMNGELKSIFESYRQEASAEFEKITLAARAEANKLVEEFRRRISVEVGDAARKMKEEAPLVAQAMATKLLEKDNGRLV